MRILLRGNQAREDPNERESQTGGIPLCETAHRGEYVLEQLSHGQSSNEKCAYNSIGLFAGRSTVIVDAEMLRRHLYLFRRLLYHCNA